MKGTKILSLIALAAGAAVVGATFATWGVSDEADPFGVKISPSSISTADLHLVTLKYGSAPLKANIENLESGKPRMAAVVDLVAETSNEEAYSGAFTMTLVDQTEGEKAAGEAKLIDNVTVDLYHETIGYESIGGEVNAGALVGKTSIAHIPLPGEQEGDDPVYTVSKTISVAHNDPYRVFVVVQIGTEDAKVLQDIANDVVYLQMDWGKGANSIEATQVYFEAPSGARAYAHAWKGSEVNAPFPGVLMEDDGQGLYSYVLSTQFDNIIFSYQEEDGGVWSQTYQSADLEVTNTIRQQTPSYSKATNSWGMKPDTSLANGYYVMGSINGWKAGSSWLMTVDPQNANHYSFSNANLPAGATLKVWSKGMEHENPWFSNGSVWDNCGFTLDGDGNLVVSEQGVYTIDLYVVDNDSPNHDHHIVLSKSVA